MDNLNPPTFTVTSPKVTVTAYKNNHRTVYQVSETETIFYTFPDGYPVSILAPSHPAVSGIKGLLTPF